MYVFDSPVVGHHHQDLKIICPKCDYVHFDMRLNTAMTSLSLACRNPECNYCSTPVGGIFEYLEILGREVVKHELKQKPLYIAENAGKKPYKIMLSVNNIIVRAIEFFDAQTDAEAIAIFKAKTLPKLQVNYSYELVQNFDMYRTLSVLEH